MIGTHRGAQVKPDPSTATATTLLHAPGELKSPRQHEDETFIATPFRYLRAVRSMHLKPMKERPFV